VKPFAPLCQRADTRHASHPIDPLWLVKQIVIRSPELAPVPASEGVDRLAHVVQDVALEFKIVVGGVQKAVRSKAAVGIWRIRSDVVVKTIADALDIKHTPQRPLTALILQVVDDV